MNRPRRDSLVPFVESACFERFMGLLQFLTACRSFPQTDLSTEGGRKRRDKSLPKQTDRPHQKVHGNMRRRRIPQVHLTALESNPRSMELQTPHSSFSPLLSILLLLVPIPPVPSAARWSIPPLSVDDLVSVRLFAVFCGHQCRRRRRMKLGKVHVVRACRTARQI